VPKKQLAARQIKREMLETWIIKMKRNQQRRTRRTNQKGTNKKQKGRLGKQHLLVSETFK
jgi:hypothetical protein